MSTENSHFFFIFPHLEWNRVEQFQQAGEGDRPPVVRRGRAEEAMLEQEAEGMTALA
jgi:hypothetical protein